MYPNEKIPNNSNGFEMTINLYANLMVIFCWRNCILVTVASSRLILQGILNIYVKIKYKDCERLFLN